MPLLRLKLQFDNVPLHLQDETSQIQTLKTDKVDKDRDRPFLKDLHFKVSDSIQVILDLVQFQTQGIIFLVLDSDQLQDQFPDQDLEISINQLNVTIVTAWVTLQIIVSDVRIEIIREDNPIRIKEVITETLKDTPIIQTTDQILDTGFPTQLNVG